MSEWRECSLDEIGQWGSGGTPLSSEPTYYNGTIPWLIIEDLNDGIVTTSQKSITEVGLKNSSAKLLEPGTLLIAMYGSIGKLGITGIRCATNQAIAFCKCNLDLVDIKFLFYYLLDARDRLTSQGRGGTQQNINQEMLRSFKIPLPPLPEQQRIAAILDRADRLHRTRRYAMQVSDSFLQAVFIEMFGDPVKNPKKWVIHRLGKHLTFVTSGSRGWAEFYAPQGVRFIRSFDVQMNEISDVDAVFVNPPDSAEARRTLVRSDDVLLTITGSRVGRVAYVSSTISEAYVSQHVAILRLDKSVRSDYASMFLSLGRGGQQQISKFQYGQTKPGLNFDQIRSFEIPVPPLALQEKFARIVQQFDRLRAQQREAERQAEQLFQTLLHRAFTGKL